MAWEFCLDRLGGTGLAYGSTDVFAKQGFTHALLEGVSKLPALELADAMLIRSKAWKWNRYLKDACISLIGLTSGLNTEHVLKCMIIHGDPAKR